MPEILKDEISGTSALSLDSEVGDPSELSSSVKVGTRRLWKKHQLTGETPDPRTKKKINQQKTPPVMACNTENTTNTLDSEVELTPQLLLLEKGFNLNLINQSIRLLNPFRNN